jgi:tetratricopeptide (TPR) repeat protein
MRAVLFGGLMLAISAHLAFAADKTAVNPAPAMPADPAEHYAACMDLAKKHPADGWEASLAWAGEGGGEPAKHCGAVALIGLKQFGEAAMRLEDLAKESHDEPPLRAGMLAQAGQAWLLEGQPGRAYADQTAALKLTPAQTDLLIDRAESSAMGHHWQDAIIDLDQAIGLAPNRADAYTFRAAAKRELNDLKGAAADALRAVELDPDSADAWLEDGNVQFLAGDKKSAHASWVQVLRLAPQSPAADSARANLEKLDVKQ